MTNWLPSALLQDEELCLEGLFSFRVIIVFQRFYLAPQVNEMLVDDG